MPEPRLNQRFAIVGTFVHSSNEQSLLTLQDHCLGVANGKIIFLQKWDEDLLTLLQEHNILPESVIYLKERQFLIPGFVDTHIHASQYPNCGKGLDEGLLSWLHKYTFPVEAKFADLEFATETYSKVISRVIKNGTTTACYYATIDTDATLRLCDIVDKAGQRAVVGKVNMDQNSPDFYKEETTQSFQNTIRYVNEVINREYQLVKPCITPRFAISCCMDLMKQLGQLARSHHLHVQTHICETRDECTMVQKLYPESKSYTDVYEQAGLLTKKTVLAHGIYLSKEERETIKKRRSGISHCPNSNLSFLKKYKENKIKCFGIVRVFCFIDDTCHGNLGQSKIRSGLLDVKGCFEDDIAVGLGTDISGGYSPSIMDAMRTAISTSNTIAMQRGPSYTPLDYKDVFRMATLGGARVLDMDDIIGNFEVGKEFDALVIDPKAAGSVIDVFENDSIEDVIQKFVFLGGSTILGCFGAVHYNLQMCGDEGDQTPACNYLACVIMYNC